MEGWGRGGGEDIHDLETGSMPRGGGGGGDEVMVEGRNKKRTKGCMCTLFKVYRYLERYDKKVGVEKKVKKTTNI
jgi:hypothetical protein